jgi:V/A-type H+-transporting ATPase subunit E
LLKKIDEEGLKKTEAKSAELLAQARLEADALLAQARAEGAELLEGARREAELLRQNSEQALRQAARNVLLELRGVLEQRLRQAVESLMQASLPAEQLAQIIASLCTAYLAQGGKEDRLELLLPEQQYQELVGAVNAALAADLRQNCELSPSRSVTGGFKLLFKGSDVLYDFTDKALAETLTAHLSPKITGILSEQF